MNAFSLLMTFVTDFANGESAAYSQKENLGGESCQLETLRRRYSNFLLRGAFNALKRDAICVGISSAEKQQQQR